ncbi:MAG: helix-turn-helix transcriptional regulator [Coxiellaceae bacterium]|nr:helix-turn-helix transcriptional regulator [Coxiellaceae bacterium]
MLQLSEARHLVNQMNSQVWQQRDADALLKYFDRDISFCTQGSRMSIDEVYSYVEQSRELGVSTHLKNEPTIVLQPDDSMVVWSEYEMRNADNKILQTVDSMNQYECRDGKIVSNFFMWNNDLKHIMSHARANSVNVTDSTITPGGGVETLTLRELQCFHALIQGASPKQVARQLGLSPRTIEEHIARFKTKLNVKTFDQLMDFAMANDLLQVTPLLQVMLDHANIATA